MGQKENSHNAIEKVVFVTGLLLIGGVIGYLVYLTFQEKKEPPHLVITTVYKPGMAGYAYEVTVRNSGEETASDAHIQFALYQKGKVVENGTISLDYVPVQSTETGWIVFQRKKQSQDSLVVSSITFLKP